MEIKEGEYVRTKRGIIRKIDKIEKCKACKENLYINKETIKNLHFTNSYHLKDITKHSKNIIDLIEVGDFVNGHKILEVRRNEESGLRYLMYDYVPIKFYVERTDKIKTILTHEQFEQNVYRLEEK